MKYYCVNKNAQSAPEDGEHEVHTEGCSHPPLSANKDYLGDLSNCHQAITEAKKLYDNVDGCAYCCPACHTR